MMTQHIQSAVLKALMKHVRPAIHKAKKETKAPAGGEFNDEGEDSLEDTKMKGGKEEEADEVDYEDEKPEAKYTKYKEPKKKKKEKK